jgi:hypothetical protein
MIVDSTERVITALIYFGSEGKSQCSLNLVIRRGQVVYSAAMYPVGGEEKMYIFLEEKLTPI